ncbi:MAG: prepilin-type N-terminal cleavage/methylation domain-containing protein [Oscillospiraceae bacterium]
MKKPLNNKGFSLVELLIALVILAIVVTPLLHTFVTAAVTTARSRQIGDATLACQNIAEAVEANDLGALLTDTNVTKYFAADNKGLYDYDDSVGYTGGAAYTAGADVYHLGVTALSAGASTFNAMVTLDATAHQKPDNSGVNDVDITDYSNMDAVFFQSTDADNPDELSYADFRSYADAQHADWSESSVHTFRTIELTVTQTGNKVYAELVFGYRYTYTYQETLEDGTTQVSSASWTDDNPPTYTLFPQGFTVTNGVLPNLYLMYFPMYGSASETNDTIVVNNPNALPFKLFLVKEKSSTVTAAEETQYHAAIQQKVPSLSSDTAEIYSNARENLLDGTTIASVQYKIQRGSYFSQNGTFAGEQGSLVSKSAKNRMYQVNIAIYDKNDTGFTGTPIYTFTSTKLQ